MFDFKNIQDCIPNLACWKVSVTFFNLASSSPEFRWSSCELEFLKSLKMLVACYPPELKEDLSGITNIPVWFPPHIRPSWPFSGPSKASRKWAHEELALSTQVTRKCLASVCDHLSTTVELSNSRAAWTHNESCVQLIYFVIFWQPRPRFCWKSCQMGYINQKKTREIWEHVITTCSLLLNVKFQSMFAFKCQQRTIRRHCLVLDSNYLATKMWQVRCACFHGATLFHVQCQQ